ncbi:MAG TPA: hypothetical protein VGO62_19985 [Myxococcota bacterium]
MSRTPITASLVVVIALIGLIASACPAAGGTCTAPGDCQAAGAAPCPACAPLATALCQDGVCSSRPPDAVSVSATVTVERHLANAGTVRGFVYAVAAADRTCDDVGSFSAFPASLNAFGSGQLSFEGGAQHDGVGLGRAPEGAFLVLGLATDGAAGAGNVVAHGCTAAVAQATSSTTIELDLAP